MKPRSIMFTSAGRRVELFRAFRQAIGRLEAPVSLVASDVSPLAPTLQLADEASISPASLNGRFVDFILEVCGRHDVCLVFPLIDPDIPILAKLRPQLEDQGVAVAVMDEEAVAITQDKQRTAAFFEEAGVPAPRTWTPQELAGSDIQFPLFIKPRGGSSSFDAYRVNNERELEFFLGYVKEPLVQDFLEGPEVTIDLAYDLEGNLLSLCQRQRIAVRAGEVSKGITIWNEEIAQHCIRIGEALGARGPITIQCMMRDGTPHFTEVNGRFGGGFPLAVAAGLDVPGWYVQIALGQTPHPPALGTYRQGLYLTRFDDTFFLTEDQLPATRKG